MKKGALYIVLTTLIFSTIEITIKLCAGQFHPIQMTFTRFFIGGLVLIPFALGALKKKGARIAAQDIGSFALLGFLGVLVSMSLYQMSVESTPASVVAVLFSSNPVFVAIFAFFLLKEPIHKHNLAALVLEVVGIFIIINPFGSKLSAPGVILAIASTLFFSLYGVAGKRKCEQYGGIVVTCVSFLFGSLQMLLMIGLSHIPAVSSALSASGMELFASIPLFSGYAWDNLALVAFICLINTGAGYACYFKAMEETSAQQASLAFFFKPILAPILSLIILQEAIPMNMLCGILLVLAGSLCSILPGLLEKHRRHGTAVPAAIPTRRR